MDAILAVAKRHDIAVVEDAAEAIGSEYRGRRAGAFGAASAFSFHGSKTLTTGEGGMLVTDDDAFHARVQVLRDHGRQPGDHSFYNHEIAYKYKMSALQAALGLAQLERIDELVEKKRAIFGWYHDRLSGHREICLNAEPPQTRNSYWMVTAVFPESWGGKKAIIRRLAEQGIDSRPVFSPLSSLPAYEGTPQAEQAAQANRISYRLGPNGVNLPSALCISR
jgi:perosamine synthetase